jgi:hypothetical protein
MGDPELLASSWLMTAYYSCASLPFPPSCGRTCLTAFSLLPGQILVHREFISPSSASPLFPLHFPFAC